MSFVKRIIEQNEHFFNPKRTKTKEPGPGGSSLIHLGPVLLNTYPEKLLKDRSTIDRKLGGTCRAVISLV
jgi:hypothetical protein